MPFSHLPVEKASQSTRKQSNLETRSETKDEDAQASTSHSHQQDGFPADLVAEPAPQKASGEFSKSEGRGNHAGIERDLALVIGDVEVFNHMVDVRENRHEGDRLADPARSCPMG